ERARSDPPPPAPPSRATSASALMPAPPIPTNQKRLPSSKRDQLLGDLVRRIRPRDPEHGLAHLREPARVAEQRTDDLRHLPELGVRDEDRTARRLEVLRVFRLVVARAERVGHEHRGLAGGGELPDSTSRARENEIGRAERCA